MARPNFSRLVSAAPSRDAATSSRDLAASSRDLAASSADLALSSRDSGASSADVALSSSDVAACSGDFAAASWLSAGARRLVVGQRSLPPASRGLSAPHRRLPTASSVDFAPSSAELGAKTRLNRSSTELGSAVDRPIALAAPNGPAAGKELRPIIEREHLCTLVESRLKCVANAQTSFGIWINND